MTSVTNPDTGKLETQPLGKSLMRFVFSAVAAWLLAIASLAQAGRLAAAADHHRGAIPGWRFG